MATHTTPGLYRISIVFIHWPEKTGMTATAENGHCQQSDAIVLFEQRLLCFGAICYSLQPGRSAFLYGLTPDISNPCMSRGVPICVTTDICVKKGMFYGVEKAFCGRQLENE